jgi:hypothetical protein
MRTSSFQSCIAHLHDAIDSAGKRAPADALVGEGLAAACGEAIETAAAPAGGLPRPLHPAATFEAVEQRVKRRDVETDDALGAFGNEFADFIAVAGLVLEQRQNQ